MSNIRLYVQILEEPSKSIANILIEFYDTMKELEKYKDKGGMQATKIVMTINDIEDLLKKHDSIWKH
jgi:cell division protein ZapA (FtsZ GTPase activity inhibitor)